MLYVDEAVAQLRRQGLCSWPGPLPLSMVESAGDRDWTVWKPIPSDVTDRDLDELEEEIGTAYPPLYRQFLRYRHFVSLTERGVRFAHHLPGQWRDTLLQSYFAMWDPARIIERGLVPFGDESFMDAGPVCFDTRSRAADGDCPVVFWDHEWIDTEQEIRPMFSSAQKMFECLTLVARHDLNFFSHRENDDPSLLPQKRELLRQFLALDPTGAGGPARAYWTASGVNGA